MKSPAPLPMMGLQGLVRRGRRLVDLLARLHVRTWLVPLPLEALEWASADGGTPSPDGMPPIYWQEPGPTDQFPVPELRMAAGAQVVYRTNVLVGPSFQATCRLTADADQATPVRFVALAHALTDRGREVRQELTLTAAAQGGVGFELDLGAFDSQRIELTLRVESTAPTHGGVWTAPRLQFAVPRPGIVKRLRAYFGSGGRERLQKVLDQIFHGGQTGPGTSLPTPAKDHRAEASASLSILLAVDGKWPDRLRRAVESVLAQSSPCWELLLIPGPGTPAGTLLWLEECARNHQGIRLLPTMHGDETAERLQTGLQAATGAFVATLREVDLLASRAVEEVLERLAGRHEAHWLYTNEEWLDERGVRLESRHKPLWGRDSLLSGLLPGRWVVVRRESVVAAGGFRPGFAAAEEYELVLRLVEGGHVPLHLETLAYRARRSADEAALSRQAEQTAAAAFLARTSPGTKVAPGLDPLYPRVSYPIEGTPLISIVIPTNGVRRVIDGKEIDLLATCVRSIVEKSDYPHFEVLCVDNANLQPPTLAALEALQDPRVRVISFTAPFNLADKFNWAVAQARGEHLLLLNDDTEVITPGWLAAMLEYSQLPRVGAVGAKLFFPDGTLQHVGVPFILGLPHHRAYGLPRDLEQATPELRCVRNFAAVTGACVMTRRALYNQVGGFDRMFRLNYNDVDYCLKVREAGHDVVFTPFAELWHFESVSRVKGVAADEIDLLHGRWGGRVSDDLDERPVVWARGLGFNWLPN